MHRRRIVGINLLSIKEQGVNMYIYFKKDEKLDALIVTKEDSSFLLGKPLFGKDLVPHINVSDDYEAVMNGLEGVRDNFFKATLLFYPNYQVNRITGKYVLGDAHATLKMTSDDSYMFVAWTDTWDGIKDMHELSNKLYAGTIYPVESHEKSQWSRLRSFFSSIFHTPNNAYSNGVMN